jgi:hypothetical protein
MHFEFTQNIGTMRFRSLDTDPERPSDFFAGFALGHELHNLTLLALRFLWIKGAGAADS